MKCKSCQYEITEHQSKEHNGCCCSVCENRQPKPDTNCKNCGLPLKGDYIFDGFCSGGCSGEYQERISYRK